MTIKIANVSDIHFGVSPLLTRIQLENLRTFFLKPLLAIKPDIIAITGDYWDKGLQLDSFESEAGVIFMKELVDAFKDTFILVLRGTKSHDRKQLNMFNIFKSNTYRIYNEVSIDTIDGLNLLLLPEENVPISYYDDYLNNKNQYDWIFFHGMMNFAGGYASKQAMHNKTVFHSSLFDQIVSGLVTGGHIHIKCQEKKCRYTGSFDRFRHGEEEPKGFFVYEYDTVTKSCVKETFYENKGASLYKTIYYSSIKNMSFDDLIIYIEDESKKNYSVRIFIEKEDQISQESLNSIIAVTTKFPNVILKKEVTVKPKSIAENEQQRLRSEERKKRISEYDNLTFEEITIKYARDKYNGIINEKDIAKILS